MIEASGDLAAGEGGCGRSSRANGVEVAVEVELDAIIVFQIPTYDRYCVGTGWIARCPRIWKLEYCGGL